MTFRLAVPPLPPLEQVVHHRTEHAIAHASKLIWVTFEREGIHCYPAAATTEALQDVAFLSHPHRHIFKFRVEIAVTHDDRDIEFIQFKRWLQSLYADGVLELNHKSCEMICDDLARIVLTKYPYRGLRISVSEDGENGATAVY